MMFGNRNNRMLAVMAMVLMICTVLCGCGGDPVETTAAVEQTQAAVETTQAVTEASPLQVLSVESIEEQDDMMVVTTTFGQVKYPFAFGDLIRVKAVDDGSSSALEFFALISGEEYPVFAVRFGSIEGILLGTMEIPGETEPRAVSAEIYPADAAQLGDKANTFYAAQECFNDVVASLNENQGFAASE